MKPNQLRSMAAVVALWLSLSVGCDPPDPCKNGECCGLDEMTFVRQVEGARAEYDNGVFNFQEPVTGYLLFGRSTALTCPTQQDMINALHLKSNLTVDANGTIRLIDSTHAYPYRVWGRLYKFLQPGFFGDTHAIYLDKVESVY